MITGLVCPVCDTRISQALNLGDKVTCEHCESVHRVRGDRESAHLHILIENLQAPEEAGMETHAAADEDRPAPVGPKLTTWKDRARAETTDSSRSSSKSRRPSRRRGR